MRKKFKAIVLAGLIGLCLTGCGSSNSTESSSMKSSAVTMSEEVSVQTDDMYVTDAGTGAVSNTEAQSDRKLIKTVDLSVETEEYDKLLTNLQSKVASLGGYVENFSTNGYDLDRYASLKVRIPADRLDEFVNAVAEESNILYRNETIEDVTLNYVDLDSHKRMLEAEEDRLLALMEQAETIEDLIALENSLTDIRYQIESMESQLRTFDNQVDYSTVNIDIEEVIRISPQSSKTAGERMYTGFMDSLYQVGVGIMNFGINLVIHLPYLILFGMILILILLIVKCIIWYDKKQAKKRLAGMGQNVAGGQPPMQGHPQPGPTVQGQPMQNKYMQNQQMQPPQPPVHKDTQPPK